ncbi:CST complex subunit Ten1 [Xylariaceae sp. FL1019]|nr:CST complex subunit Ten1 [Xylariaceae sp. FL1019]
MSSAPLPVEAYSIKSGQLTLRHNCPKENNEVAKVDVKLLLSTIKAEQTDVGQWIHVIGYITATEPNPKLAAQKVATCETGSAVSIQALLIWTARDLDIEKYERSMLAEAD